MQRLALSVEKYLKPEVVRQISRLDLRAQFVVRGFLQGLHASPFHGFSVEFSEHRKYTSGDDPKDIDWLVYAKTDKYYVKKFEAETNITGYLVMDLSQSMGYTHRQELTKFDYAISLAAALCYLMVQQQDPVGLVTFDQKIRSSVPPKSKRTQIGNVLSLLARLKPTGQTDIAYSISQLSAMLRHRSLIMLFSDLLADPEPIIQSLRRVRHGGHDMILFHILDEAEVNFPFEGMLELEDPESSERMEVDATGFRDEYLQEIREFRDMYRRECIQTGIDYVPLDTSMQFDKALTEYLLSRRHRM
ncbi:MAG: DUF58 domain-containing protein [Planctomycetales bacterium]|nr:DUF58 domain-containing protein [Planctomycetales bacterium]